MASIEGLPGAVLQLIFEQLDPESLWAVRESSPAIYSAFNCCKTWLLPPLLRREIGDDLWVDALTAHSSWGARRAKHEHVVRFLELCYARHEERLRLEMDIGNAREMLRLHDTVLFLCEKLGNKALQGGRPTEDEGPMTPTERLRICRALYRFELSCNATQDTAWYDLTNPHYAPWENEQLCCIYEALVKLVYPAVNLMFGGLTYQSQSDTIRADVEANCRAQVSWGLVHVRAHVEAASPDVLVPRMRQDSIRAFYFHEYMRHAMRPSPVPLARVVWDGVNPITFSPSYPDDGDTGPRDAWAWAHRGLMLFQTANHPLRFRVRIWFYVFWDRARLNARGTMGRPWRY